MRIIALMGVMKIQTDIQIITTTHKIQIHRYTAAMQYPGLEILHRDILWNAQKVLIDQIPMKKEIVGKMIVEHILLLLTIDPIHLRPIIPLQFPRLEEQIHILDLLIINQVLTKHPVYHPLFTGRILLVEVFLLRQNLFITPRPLQNPNLSKANQILPVRKRVKSVRVCHFFITWWMLPEIIMLTFSATNHI